MASKLWSRYNITYSKILLDRALLSWKFLINYPNPMPSNGFINPPGHVSGPYPDTDDTDNRAWLAAELYRSTCHVSYGRYYLNFIKHQSNYVAMGGFDFTDYRLEAAYAFYSAKTSCQNEPVDLINLRVLVKQGLFNNVDGNRLSTLNNPYHGPG